MMPTHQTSVTQLLRIYHGSEAVSAESIHLPDLGQVNFLCDIGLGPIAFHSYSDRLRVTDPAIFSVLQSADLTTRVIYKQLDDAVVELLTSLQSVGVVPVLCKGISTANEFYSPPHLRLMGDVDILVKFSEVDIVMSKLADLGYEIDDRDWHKYYEKGHHHLPGARNPNSGVTIEVHTGLIPPNEAFAHEPIFQMSSIESQIIECDYRGISAARFAPEFQLVYTVSHWALDGDWAGNITSINDVIHILRRHEAALNWEMLAAWIAENPRLYPNLAVLVDYLEQAGILSMTSSMRGALENTETELQPGTKKVLMWLLNHYPFNARNKTRDGYARWRARAMWQELTKPNSRDITIPYKLLRTMFRSIHHGKYNPLGLLLSLFRKLVSRLRGG